MPLSEHGTTSFVDGSTGPGHAGRPEYARGAGGVGASASSADSTLDPDPEPEAALKTAGAVKTEKVMMLAEISQRLTSHVGQRLGAKYVKSINRGDLKKKIEAMLAAVDASLDLEASSSKAQKKADLAEAKSFQESTEKFSAGVLAAKEAELQAGVDAATEAKRIALNELNVAQSDEAAANKESLEAQAAHKAEQAQEVRETVEAKRVRQEQEDAQDTTKAQNTKLANSKQAQGLKYLGQERATVDSIEKLLANLGKGYKFDAATRSVAATTATARRSSPTCSRRCGTRSRTAWTR